jgi:hypothetical protein
MNNTLQHLIRFPSGENRLYQASHHHLIRQVTSLLLGVCLLFFGAGTLVVDNVYAGWIELSPTGGPPTARGWPGTTAVRDPATNRMIIFAGMYHNRNSGSWSILNDTWVLTNANGLGGTPQWTQLSTAGSPPSRAGHSAVYDSTNNRMIIFDGCGGFCQPVRNDVWVLTNANGLGGTPTWIQLSPTGGPPARRQNHIAVYDFANNRMIIFGGQNGSGNGNATYGDVWILTNANGLGGTPAWIRLTPTGGPPLGQYGPSSVYDPTNNRMIVFGGSGSNAVWVLSNANGLGGTPTWTNLIAEGTAGSPPLMMSHSAVYNTSNNEMTIFGRDGVWVLADANGLSGTPTWMERNSIGTAPTERSVHGAVYDSVTERMTIFGGNRATPSRDVLNDTWVLTNDDSNNGLVAYYPFNGNANDESGNGHHGTVHGAILAKDRFGNSESAYSFDGENDYILIPDNNLNGVLESGVDFTISMWINKTPNKTSPIPFSLMSPRYSCNGGLEWIFYGNGHSSTDYGFGISDIADCSAIASARSASVTHNEWVFGTIIYQNGNLYVYANGDLLISDEVGDTSWVKPNPSKAGGLVLGTASHAVIHIGSVHHFTGLIDDIRIYNRALSKAEIQALYGVVSDNGTCQLYAVHDGGLNDSQLFTVNQTTLEVNALGKVCPGCDIEALDSHPQTDKLFAASGDDTDKKGYLYEVNQSNGDLTPIGNIVDDGEIGNRPKGYDYKEVNALSFRADGTLWGWAENEGLLLINTGTAQAKLKIEYAGEIEDITWNEAGTTLYAVENIHNDPVDSHGAADFEEGVRLLTYDGEMVKPVCQGLMNGFEIEALETLPGDSLLFGFHGSHNLNIGIIEPSNCNLIAEKTISTPYNDVEGIAWPKKACTK